MELLGPSVPNNKMSYRDFYIRYEHNFLRNIYSKEQLSSSPQISTPKNCYKTHQKLIKTFLALESVLISHSDIVDIEESNDDTKKKNSKMTVQV